MDTDKILHRELSESIIGAGMRVLNTLKPGLNEKAYENALVIELQKHGHRVDRQRRFEVFDLLVDDAVIVDPKVADDFTPTHMAQMVGYLAITQLRLALLLNFKHADLRWKRVVR